MGHAVGRPRGGLVNSMRGTQQGATRLRLKTGASKQSHKLEEEDEQDRQRRQEGGRKRSVGVEIECCKRRTKNDWANGEPIMRERELAIKKWRKGRVGRVRRGGK